LIRGARDGTLFLDEIGDLSIDLQPKLLRFLESGEIHPLGEQAPLNVNVRVVAATNANLEQLVKGGRFREDLFYRLNVVTIEIPPLRARRDEIPALVQHLLAKAAAEFGKGGLRISEEAMEHLLCYSWPGNVRQLQNEMRRIAAVVETDALVEASALHPSIRQETSEAVKARAPNEMAIPLSDKLAPAVARLEREMIARALRTHRHVDAAARALGLSRKGLYLKRQRHGL
jgi:hydrogenase-4 transcriptional activator